MHQGVMTGGALPIHTAKGDAVIARALASARDHLDMPVAYLSEFDGTDTVLRHVDTEEGSACVRRGDRQPLDLAYCRHILEGRLPQIIPDTDALALCRALPVTAAIRIGSHAGVPVRRHDGSIFGMFCCFSHDPHPTLNARDLKVLRHFAAQAEAQIARDLLRETLRDDTASRITAMLQDRAFDIVFQPIYRLDDGHMASVEALCRFRSDPYLTPDRWFADARTTGMQAELEVAAIEEALTALANLPPAIRMSVNASSDTVASGRLLEPFERFGTNRITLEITEHDHATDARDLLRSIKDLRALGALVAIDDVGAGYSGLQQILKLQPDILKLDMALVRDIDLDPARQALAAAMVSFASRTGAQLTAEGIERIEEYDVLRDLGIDYGQGWLLGRPGALAAAARVSDLPTRPRARAS